MLTREQILGLDDLEIRELEVPFWGTVKIRMMTALERGRVEAKVATMTDKNQASVMTDLKAMVAAIVVCDDEGKSIFTENDTRALGGKNHKALEAILQAAQDMAQMTPEAIEANEGN